MAGRQERLTKKGNFRRVGQMREGLGLERDRDLETQGYSDRGKSRQVWGTGTGARREAGQAVGRNGPHRCFLSASPVEGSQCT